MVNKELVMEIATFMIDWMKDVTKQLTRIADANEASAKRLITMQDQTDKILGTQKEIDDYHDYVKTINLNVPKLYRCPQLDLSMVRMGTALAQVEMVLATIPKLNWGDPETPGIIRKELREALIPK